MLKVNGIREGEAGERLFLIEEDGTPPSRESLERVARFAAYLLEENKLSVASGRPAKGSWP